MRLKEFAATTALATVLTLGMAGGAAQAAFLTLYSDTLSGADLTVFGGAWPSQSPSLFYEVKYEIQPDNKVLWQYTYTLGVGNVASSQGDISHMTVEVSPDFQSSDIVSNTWTKGTEVGDYPTAGDPGMPSAIRGLKFDNATSLTETATITTYRSPVWADFYAKDGNAGGSTNYLYNAGFGNPDTDPNLTADFSTLLLLANATVQSTFASSGCNSGNVSGCATHVLAPDTVTTVVPIPAALPLLGTAVAGLGLAAWRRRAKAA